MLRIVWQRSRWRYLVASLGLVALLGVTISWIVGGILIASRNRPVGPPPEGSRYQVTTLSSRSGSTIATWWSQAESPSRGTVVLVHPLDGDRRAMLERAELFHEHGYHTVSIDLSGHGESSADGITVGYRERWDVLAAVAFAHHQFPNQPVIVVGRSLGGAAALFAMPSDIDGLVLESVYPSLAQAVHNRVSVRLGWLSYLATPALLCQVPLRLGVGLSELRPIDSLAKLSCPVLFLCGARDQHTTVEETEGMFQLAKSPKQLVIFANSAHTDLFRDEPQLYADSVLAFMDLIHRVPRP